VTYWDTSALLKLYAEEPDSPKFWKLLLASLDAIRTSTIARAEMFCALRKKEFSGELNHGAAAVLFARFIKDVQSGRIVLIALTDEVYREMESFPHLGSQARRPLMLRTLDLIHIASARAARSRQMVATDERLRAAAQDAGLTVVPA
jgi:predicted nucleic acid-binding protein